MKKNIEKPLKSKHKQHACEKEASNNIFQLYLGWKNDRERKLETLWWRSRYSGLQYQEIQG